MVRPTPATSSQRIPADVRLVAAVSRLIDIHQSRATGLAAGAPDVPDTAGPNLFLALSALRALGNLELTQGQTLVSVKTLLEEIRLEYPEATEEALTFCLESLSQSREIRYGTTDDDGTVRYARTSDTTALVNFDASLRQTALTENGRLLLRVSSLKESWLYSDIDAERIIKAIERGQFEDIPRFCREMVLDLAAKARQISDVVERPALADLRELLIVEGARISAILQDSTAIVQKAMAALFAPGTIDTFELWRATRGVSFGLGNLQAELEIVLQSTEKLSRRFIQFLDGAQRIQSVRAPTMRFLDIVASLHRSQAGTANQLDALLSDILPWGTAIRVFSPDMLAGEVRLADLLAKTDEIPVDGEFDTVHGLEDPVERMHQFLHRNADKIVTATRRAPMSLSKLLAMEGFELLEGESLSDFVGLYTFPEVLAENGARLIIGSRPVLIECGNDEAVLVTSDPVLMIEDTAQ